MKPESAEKAATLLEELKELEKYKKILSENTAHFEFILHYGNVEHWEKVIIERRHNSGLLNELERIIKKVEKELEDL